MVPAMLRLTEAALGGSPIDTGRMIIAPRFSPAGVPVSNGSSFSSLPPPIIFGGVPSGHGDVDSGLGTGQGEVGERGAVMRPPRN